MALDNLTRWLLQDEGGVFSTYGEPRGSPSKRRISDNFQICVEQNRSI